MHCDVQTIVMDTICKCAQWFMNGSYRLCNLLCTL